MNSLYIINNYIWFFELLEKQEDIGRFALVVENFSNYLREDNPFFEGNEFDINSKNSKLLSEIFKIFFRILYDYRVEGWETGNFVELTYKKDKIIYFSKILKEILKKYISKEKQGDLKDLKNKIEKLYLNNPY